MKNFHRGGKSGGDRDHKGFGKKSFGGGSRGFGGRGGDRPTEMFKAVCSQCGKDCQLPFRPNGNRPVFCSNCFEIQKNENPEGSEKFGRPERFEKKSFDRPSFSDRKVFEAVCGNCGDECLVPFQPFPGKPVFCKKCFNKGETTGNKSFAKPDHANNSSGVSSKAIEELKSKIEMLNIKLDRILRELTPKEEREVVEEEVETEEVVKETPKKEKAAKPAKKAVTKKKK